jgi:hypothetical protein
MLLFFILVYTQGLWYRVGVPKAIVQGGIYLLPVVVLLSRRETLGRLAPGFLILWFYVGWSLCACIYHDEGVVRGLLYSRYLVAAYLVFWATWNSRFTPRQILWINTVIFGLFLLQVAAALGEWLVLGQLTEANVGTLGSQTGAIATLFPMFAFSCMLAFFLYYNRPVFLVLGFSFFLVGYASGKLGIYFFIPAMLVAGLILYGVREGPRPALRRTWVTTVVALCALPFLVFLLSHTHRTQTLQIERRMINKISSFWDYTLRSSLESRSWYSGSRLTTSVRIIDETFRRGPSVFLLGQGTHVLRDMSGQQTEEAYDEYGIIYGMVGWSTDALTVGWPAMFAHVAFYAYLFYRYLQRKRALQLDRYWKAMALTIELGFVTFLLVYFLYSSNFTVGGWLSSVYLYFLAVLLAPQYEETVCIPPVEIEEPETESAPRYVPCRPIRCP